VHGLDELEVPPMEEPEDDCDDSDIPSSAVIRDALGIEVSRADVDGQVCVGSSKKDEEHGGLVADDENEDVWAWNNGERWGDKLPVEEVA
jgi:hypothetical protein